MKKALKIFLLISILLLISGCDTFDKIFKKEEEHFVTFSYNDGVYDNYKCKINNNKINCAILEPTNDKLVFMGWYDDEDNKIDLDGEFNSDITLHPKFLTEEDAQKEKESEKKYTITFDMNGGTGNIGKIEVEYEGQLYKLNNLPVRSGYTFMGFYDNSEYYKGKQYYNENGDAIRNFDKVNNITLYAGWQKKKSEITKTTTETTTTVKSPETKETSKEKEEITYTLSFDLNNGNGDKPNNITISYGEKLPSISETPTRSGYIFMGWYDNKGWTKGNQYYNADNSSDKKYNVKSNLTLYAGWEKELEICNIVFYANGGTGSMKSLSAKNGETIKISANLFKREGYKFIQWNTSSNGSGKSYKDKASIKVTSNLSLYAIWEANKYTIKFDLNKGSGSKPNDVTATYGASLPSISEIPTKSGYIFMGWYDNKDWTKGNQYYKEDNTGVKNYDIKSDLTLYAGWEKKEEKATKYRVAFNPNEGSGGQSKPVDAEYGKSMPIISKTAPTRKGYTFKGWYDSITGGTMYYKSDGSSAKNYDKKTSTTLYARWEANKYTVTFDLNGGSGTKPDNVNVTYDSRMPKITETVPVREGYTFKGWYDAKSNGNQYYTEKNEINHIFDKTADLTLYAIWQINTFTVVYNGNGNTSGSTKSHTCTYNSDCKLLSNGFTKTGYTFSGWKKENKGDILAAGSSIKNAVSSGKVTYYAAWKANTFTVEYNGNGSTGGSTKSHTCTYNSDCKLSSNGFTKTGYIFTGWKKENKGDVLAASSSIKNVVTSGKVIYYAIWKEATYTVKFDLNGGSGGQTAAVKATYGKDMPQISTTKPTKKGYTFKGWYDAKSNGTIYYKADGTSARKYDKYADTTLYARWEANKYPVKFDLNGGSGNKPGDITATYDSKMPTITATKPTKKDFQFMGWYDNKDWTKGSKYYNTDGSSAKTYDKASATTLYAGWKSTAPVITTYTVSFNANEGSGGQSKSIEAEYGKSMPTISKTAPKRSGYIFQGWYDGKDFKKSKQYYDKDGNSVRNFDIKTSLKLYAGWLNKDTFIIKWDCNGGTGDTAIKYIENEKWLSPIVSTCQKDGYVFDGWYDEDGTNWTFNTVKTSFVNGTGGVKDNTVTFKAKWTKALKENTNAIKPAGKYHDLGSCTKYNGDNKNWVWPYDNEKVKGNYIGYYCSYESNTLKYYILKVSSNYILTYVWVEDAYNQLRVANAPEDTNPPSEKINDNPHNSMILTETLGKNILEYEVKDRKYQNKGLVGVNASAPIGQAWYLSVPKGWRGGPPVNVYRNQGETIRYGIESHKFYTITYGLSKDGHLKAFDTKFGDGKNYTLGNNTVKKYIEDVDQIKDTYGFRPVLIKNGKSQEGKDTYYPWDKWAKRQAICQIDKNNFVFYTSINTGTASFKKVTEIFLELGCQTAFNFDGGGSTSFFWKTEKNKVLGPGTAHEQGRISSDVLYFVEK